MARRETIDQFLAQHQGKEGAEDVAADAGVGLVKDRPGGEQRLCGSEGVLDGQQVAVAQDDLKGGDFCVGAQHEEAVEAGIGLDLGAIDDEAVAFGRFQETAEALTWGATGQWFACSSSVVLPRNLGLSLFVSCSDVPQNLTSGRRSKQLAPKSLILEATARRMGPILKAASCSQGLPRPIHQDPTRC